MMARIVGDGEQHVRCERIEGNGDVQRPGVNQRQRGRGRPEAKTREEERDPWGGQSGNGLLRIGDARNADHGRDARILLFSDDEPCFSISGTLC